MAVSLPRGFQSPIAKSRAKEMLKRSKRVIRDTCPSGWAAMRRGGKGLNGIRNDSFKIFKVKEFFGMSEPSAGCCRKMVNYLAHLWL